MGNGGTYKRFASIMRDINNSYVGNYSYLLDDSIFRDE